MKVGPTLSTWSKISSASALFSFHHFHFYLLYPVLPSPPRAASSMWPDTGSQYWAQPSWCTAASRSKGSFMQRRTRRTNATGFYFAASKRAWKPNTHPLTGDAKIRWGLYSLPLSVLNEICLLMNWQTFIFLILTRFSVQLGCPYPKRPSFSMISCDHGTVGV